MKIWDSVYIFVFKFEQSSYLFSLKNSRPCWDLNPGPPRYWADMLPIELSWLGYWAHSLICGYKLSKTKNVPVIICYVHWGSEIWTSLDFEWSKRGWVANGPYFKCDLKSGSPTIWNPDKCLHFVKKKKKKLKSGHKRLDFKWSSFQMVGTEDLQNVNLFSIQQLPKYFLKSRDLY